MPDLRPVVVFPAASTRGGVERVALETLKYLGPRYATTFVGHTLEQTAGRPAVRHLEPRQPPWSVAALRPAAFRVSAARCIPRERGTVTISEGVNAPPGEVFHVHSLHRAWLQAGKAVSLRGVHVPNQARYLLPRHQVLLALEWEYFSRHRPRRVIAVSHELADDLREIYDVPAELITVIPNGFDPAQCNAERRASLREEQRAIGRIRPDAIVVLFLANELHRKGLGVLLDAVAMAGDERVEIHIVGRTAPTAYQSQINALGLTERVVFHGASDDVGQAHAIADIFVLPTQYETFGIAALESLASGLPVILTRGTPGIGERVKHDDNGLLLDDPLDSEELSELLRLALDSERRARWSAQSPISVADLTWDNLMGRVEAVIRDAA